MKSDHWVIEAAADRGQSYWMLLAIGKSGIYNVFENMICCKG